MIEESREWVSKKETCKTNIFLVYSYVLSTARKHSLTLSYIRHVSHSYAIKFICSARIFVYREWIL